MGIRSASNEKRGQSGCRIGKRTVVDEARDARA
jgi:hypothetical protein